MQDDQARHAGKPKAEGKDTRQARLKQALRENLKRRKSQARGRSDEAAASSERGVEFLDVKSGKESDR
jgi:hypothetical protein